MRSPGCISFHSAETLDGSHFTIGTNDPVFRLRMHAATNGLLSCPENMLAIIRVDHFANQRHVNGTFLRSQPVNAIELVGPSNAIRDEVPIIVAHVGDALASSSLALLSCKSSDRAWRSSSARLRSVISVTTPMYSR